jgi:hypothetical protein
VESSNYNSKTITLLNLVSQLVFDITAHVLESSQNSVVQHGTKFVTSKWLSPSSHDTMSSMHGLITFSVTFWISLKRSKTTRDFIDCFAPLLISAFHRYQVNSQVILFFKFLFKKHEIFVLETEFICLPVQQNHNEGTFFNYFSHGVRLSPLGTAANTPYCTSPK